MLEPFNRAEFDRLQASIRAKAAATIAALDDELAATEEPPARALTVESVQQEIEVHRDAIELTARRIAKVEGELTKVLESGPFRLEEQMRERLSQLRFEHHGLTSDLRNLEALRARLVKAAS
jgi:hypothetical protein